MRIDKHLQPNTLNLTRRQHFFLSAWFNLAHRSSLDSYRMRAMNPVNILREFRKMYEPQADDSDRCAVAEELLEVFADHPIFLSSPNSYPALDNTLQLLSEAVQKHRKDSKGASEKGDNPFRTKAALLHSFERELAAALSMRFLQDSFDWLFATLAAVPQGETEQQELKVQADLERVTRDILSVVHDEGFSLESLHALYKLMSSETEKGVVAAVGSPPVPYDFMARLTKVKDVLLADATSFEVFFTIGGMPAPITQAVGMYGDVALSDQQPGCLAAVPLTITDNARWMKGWVVNNQRLFAHVVVESKDGRSAGMLAYRKIGQLLDLIRFEFGAENLTLSTDFVLFNGVKFLLLPLPELVPNPKAVRSAGNLGDFVEHLNSIGSRDGVHSDSKDRILAAFRFYRIGTDVSLFENKLVNWWTAVEYLTKGGKAGGSIGAAVEGSLVPTLGLTHVSKHLTALREALLALDKPIGDGAAMIDLQQTDNKSLYAMIKNPVEFALLLDATSDEPYIWHHLKRLGERVQSEGKIASMLRDHERRLRWQIQRVYRARCDIVHSGQGVVMIGLLCANLEFYLRVILSSMLVSFREVSTLLGPSEFFERKKHAYAQLLAELDPKDPRNTLPSSRLMLQSL